MNISFFRKPSLPFDEEALYEISFEDDLEDEEDTKPSQQTEPIIAPQTKAQDPVRKAEYGRIGIVSVEDSSPLPALLHEVRNSSLLQRIKLPRSPRIALDELYEIDGMDLVIFLADGGLQRDSLRWLSRLKQLRIPMVLLVHRPSPRYTHPQSLELASRHLGMPLIPIKTEELEESRRALLQAVLEIAPAMALALAAQVAPFRTYLFETLMERSLKQSFQAGGETAKSKSLDEIQKLLLRQIAASHGYGGPK